MLCVCAASFFGKFFFFWCQQERVMSVLGVEVGVGAGGS